MTDLEYKRIIPMNLSFFAGDKTEKATPKKKQKAREEGQVAKSQEIGTAFMFIAVFFGLSMFGGFMFENLLEIFIFDFELLAQSNTFFDMNTINEFFLLTGLKVALVVMPIFAIAMVVGVLSNVIQVGWHVTTKPLMPKFSKLNPLSGVKRLFSIQVLVTFVKSMAKFIVIAIVIYNTLMAEKEHMLVLLDMPIYQAVEYIGGVMIGLGIQVGILYIFIAILDFAYTRYKHAKDLRMSKQEVKDEYKTIEGNPQIKARIRQKMREVSMRRMMADVPHADVVITNPTHYAIALKYDREKSEAPYVVAKGMDHLAKKIKEKAKEANVTIVENKPLARMLYSSVEVGRDIPPELYEAVAEILAYVYKLKNIA